MPPRGGLKQYVNEVAGQQWRYSDAQVSALIGGAARPSRHYGLASDRVVDALAQASDAALESMPFPLLLQVHAHPSLPRSGREG